MALCSSSPDSDPCSRAQPRPGESRRLHQMWLSQGQGTRCGCGYGSGNVPWPSLVRAQVAAPWPQQPPSPSPSPQTHRREQEKHKFAGSSRIQHSRQLLLNQPQQQEHPRRILSQKPPLGSPGRAPTPGMSQPDGESFYFPSIFVFPGAGLDYSFQQHEVPEMLSSQRSIFSALGATSPCVGKQLFFPPPSHPAVARQVTPGTVATTSPAAVLMEGVEAFRPRPLKSNGGNISVGKKPQRGSSIGVTSRCSAGWGPSAAASAVPSRPLRSTGEWRMTFFLGNTRKIVSSRHNIQRPHV